MRHRKLEDLYDEHDVLKSEERQRLTPGTQEFAVLDATIRRERGSNNGGHPERLNPNIRYAESPIHDMPAFSGGVLSTLRSTLDCSARFQRHILEDDGGTDDRLLSYLLFRDIALADPAPVTPRDDKPAFSTEDFKLAFAHDFAALYARRGDPDPWGTVARTKAAVFGPASSGRRFSRLELQRLKGHWCVLGSEPSVHDDERVLVCRISEKASVKITSNRIQYDGWSTLDERQKFEAVRLGVLHAREHWNSAHAILGNVPDHTLYTLAFSDLLGVKVVGDHLPIPQEKIDACKSRLRAIYPENTLSSRTEVDTREVLRSRNALSPVRPTGRSPTKHSLLSPRAIER